MAHLPISAAAPLAAAAAAYVDGRFGITTDVWNIQNAVSYEREKKRIDAQDRTNVFYRFEDVAQDPKTAGVAFLAVPEYAAQDGRTEWTYAETYDIVLKYARWLKDEHGVSKGEIVAMDFKNKPQFVFLWWALWSLGAQPAFINSNLRDTSFIHCVKVASTRLLLLDPELEDVLTDAAKSEFSADAKGRAVDVIVLEAALEQHIAGLAPYRAPNEARSGVHMKDPAILIYTSGTTGLPKAAYIAWGKPHAGATIWRRLLGLRSTDRYFTALPLYHTSGSILGLCPVLGAACTLVISPKFSPRTFMKDVSDSRATIIQYIGELCRYLVSSPATPYDRAHSVRLAFGNGMRPDVWQKFKDRFNIPDICEFYGATEAPTATYNYSRNTHHQGAVGRAGALSRALFAGMQALVKHDHDTDEPWRDPKSGLCAKVATGEVGELLSWLDPINSNETYQGYFGNEKASQSKLIRNVLKKGDLYYRTGDLFRRDSEGRWWFMDRIGDTFRWKGENVSTAEVSEAFGGLSALKEVNIYGVQLPNHDGRAGCAAIGLAEGTDMGDILGAEIARHTRARLPRYAVPLFLRVLKTFDVTGTLKHQKVALRNEGVDPAKTGQDELYWLPPGADKYTKFSKSDWQRIEGGAAKL